MRTLIVVDVQNDFMPGGALAVPNANEVIGVINTLIPMYDQVIYTQDWHPEGHSSFVEQGGPWPVHCVQDTKGAELHSGLLVGINADVVQKGTSPAADSYSAFADDNGAETGLAERLRADGIKRIDIVGLATEYCVKFTVLDALKFGFHPTVLLAGCRGISKADVKAAAKEMDEAGAIVVK